METNQAYSHFINKWNNIMDKIAPLKTIKLSNKRVAKEKWMTKCLLKSTLTKQKLYMKAINKDNMHAARHKYVQYRNKYNTIKRKVKAKYFSDELEANEHDIKATYGT